MIGIGVPLGTVVALTVGVKVEAGVMLGVAVAAAMVIVAPFTGTPVNEMTCPVVVLPPVKSRLPTTAA